MSSFLSKANYGINREWWVSRTASMQTMDNEDLRATLRRLREKLSIAESDQKDFRDVINLEDDPKKKRDFILEQMPHFVQRVNGLEKQIEEVQNELQNASLSNDGIYI